jgi:hypothetical protein
MAAARRRVDRRRGWEQWGCRSLAHWLGWHCALDERAAHVAEHGVHITKDSVVSKWYGDSLDLGLILPALSLTLEKAGRYTPVRTRPSHATLDV